MNTIRELKLFSKSLIILSLRIVQEIFKQIIIDKQRKWIFHKGRDKLHDLVSKHHHEMLKRGDIIHTNIIILLDLKLLVKQLHLIAKQYSCKITN
jgi:hypothetical protein